MIQGKWFAPGEDLSSGVLSVRQAVFSRGSDSLDPVSWNALVYWDDIPAATGRIWWENGSYWLGDICVMEPMRGRKLGDLVLRLLLFKAQSHSAREVCLRTPPDLSGFFSRLGFTPQQDPEFPGTDVLFMCLPGDRIDLDTCKNCKKPDCPNRKS